MKNELDYLNGFDVNFLELFYSVRINAKQIYFQGYANRKSLKAVRTMGNLKMVDEYLEMEYISSSQIKVCITLTLPTE
jgi:hypothetical protein